MVGETPFQAAHRFVVGLPGGDLGVVVRPAGAARHPDLGERDDVQRQVQLPVTAARETMPAWSAEATSTGATPANWRTPPRSETGSLAGSGRAADQP